MPDRKNKLTRTLDRFAEQTSVPVRYGFALLAVGAALAGRLALESVLGRYAPYLPFALAVMIAARFAGRGPALMATAISSACVAFFFLEPRFSMLVDDPAALTGIALFLIVGSIISVLIGRLREALNAARLAAETLRASQEHNRFLADVLERADQPFGIVHLDRRVWFVNTAFGRLTGYSRDELARMDWETELTPPEWREEERANLEELRRTGHPVRYEKEYTRKNGERVPIETLVHLMNDEKGQQFYCAFLTDLTERKRAAEALRESEERLRLAQISGGVGVWDWNPGTGALHFTPELEHLYGLAPGSIQRYEDWRVLAHPDDVEQVEAKRAEAIANHTSFEIEFRILHASGEIRWLSGRGGAFYDEAGKAIRVLGVNVDITQHKRADEALRASESQFRTLSNAIPQLCWMANADGGIFWSNQRWYEFTGVTPEQTEGWGWQSVHSPETLPTVMARWRHSIETGEPFEMVCPLRSATGAFSPFLTRIVPIRDGDGKVVRWFGTSTDISEQRRIEESLREERARLKLALHASHAGTWEWDLRTGENVWSEEVWELYGLEPYSCQPSFQAWLQVMHPEDRAGAERTLQAAARDGTEVQIEFRTRGRDGAVRWLMALGRPIHDAAERMVRFIGIALDVTERKRAEEQHLELVARERTLAAEKALRESEAELARVARGLIVGEMATSIAHEVNQPLVGVVTNAEAGLRWLAGSAPNLEMVRDSLALVVRDGNRASAIIRRIREATKKGSQQYTALNLDDVILEAAEFTRGELLKRGITIVLNPAEKLPQVWGDRIQLQQVLWNLILNGAEAMDSVDGARELFLTAREFLEPGGRRAVCVSVRDSGAGIEPVEMPRVFEAFFSTKPDGMGMGLSISRSIVEAHGGRIWAEANDGPGLTVQFCLPVRSDELP